MHLCVFGANWGKTRRTSPLARYLSLIHINFIFSDTALILSKFYLSRYDRFVDCIKGTMLFLVGTICQSISKIFLINLHSNQQLKII